MKATFKELQDLVKRAGKIRSADPDRFVDYADLHLSLSDLFRSHRLGNYDAGELRDYVTRLSSRADRTINDVAGNLNELYFHFRQTIDFHFAFLALGVLIRIGRSEFGDTFAETAKTAYAGFESAGISDNFAGTVCQLHRILANACESHSHFDGAIVAICLGQAFACLAFLADSVGVDLFFGIDAILRLDFGK